MNHYLPPRSLSDVVVRYKDQTYHLHKERLYSQSRWFKAVIDLLAPGENEIEVPPLEPWDNLDLLVTYLYYPSVTPFIPILAKNWGWPSDDDEECIERAQKPREDITGLDSVKPEDVGVVTRCVQVLAYFQCDALIERCRCVILRLADSKIWDLNATALMRLLVLADEGNFEDARNALIQRIVKTREPIEDCKNMTLELYRRLFIAQRGTA